MVKAQGAAAIRLELTALDGGRRFRAGYVLFIWPPYRVEMYAQVLTS